MIIKKGYIVFPLAVLLLSLLLTAVFYPRLSAEPGYHFQSDGSPDLFLARNRIILLLLVPQLLLTALSFAVVLGTTKLLARLQSRQQTGSKVDSSALTPGTRDVQGKVEGIIRLMGNMMALPQIVLGFVMLDIFIYNSYRIHIMPLWIFAVIVMGAGVIVLGIFFLRAIRDVWRPTR